MRSVALVALSLGVLVACQPDNTKVTPATVQWMDWPAEVAAGTSFPVRLVVFAPCAWSGFEAGPSGDQSAVTFAPSFREVRDDVLCAGAREVHLVAGALDTLGNAPRLAAPSPRTYEMRAAVMGYARAADVLGNFPVWTFGVVTVVESSSGFGTRNAAGFVTTQVDTLGCLRVRPLGTYRPGTDLVLENPTDTVGISGAFVRGYIYQPTVPMCGEDVVFHLVSRN